MVAIHEQTQKEQKLEIKLDEETPKQTRLPNGVTRSVLREYRPYDLR